MGTGEEREAAGPRFPGGDSRVEGSSGGGAGRSSGGPLGSAPTMPGERPIPLSVQSLLADVVDSIGTLELLLLLYREPLREWSVDEAAMRLCVERSWVRVQLRALVRAELACQNGGRNDRRFRYYPASMQRNAAVAELARTYAERPIAVHSFVHSRPVAALRRFANAFIARDPQAGEEEPTA